MKPKRSAESKLPPWQAHNEREWEEMYRWVVGKIQETRENRKGVPLLDWFESDDAAILAAWQGNMQPLRVKYPHLAPFLHPPKRGKGKHLRPHPGDALLQAVEDAAKLIPQIWEKYFPGKVRHKEDGPSALDIAARLHGFSRPNEIAKLERRVTKPSGPPGRAKNAL